MKVDTKAAVYFALFVTLGILDVVAGISLGGLACVLLGDYGLLTWPFIFFGVIFVFARFVGPFWDKSLKIL